MIERDLVNVTDLKILRPERGGPGGDITGKTTVASNLEAIVQPSERLVRNSQGREVAATAKLYVDPDVDIVARDLVQYTVPEGALTGELEVLTVGVWSCGDETDHIRVTLGG